MFREIMAAKALAIASSMFLAVFAVTIQGAPDAFADLSFGSALNVSDDTQFSGFPRIASSGDFVYVTWIKDSSEIPLGASAMFKRSVNGGTTFSDAISLSGEPDRSGISELRIASADNDVYVVWTNDGFAEQIFFTHSSDNGATFSTPVDIKNSAGNAHELHIVAEGNNFYAAWLVGFLPNADVFFTHSSDNGATFSTPVELDQDAQSPRIAASGNNVYVAWHGNTLANLGIYFTKSTDNAETFTPPVDISGGIGGGSPKIAISGDDVHVTWFAIVDLPPFVGLDEIVFVASSHDSGTIFADPILLTPTFRNSERPSIVAEGADVHIAYFDNFAGIMLTSSSDNGSTFGAPVDVSSSDTPDSSSSDFPVLLGSGDNLYVVFVDTSERDIFISESNDGGSTFNEAFNLSNKEDFSLFPSAVLSGNFIHIAWHDVDLIRGDNEVFYIKGTQTGAPADIIPPEVIINSATDGDGNAITDGGSTSSDSLTFEFDATDAEGSIDHFDCFLLSDSVDATTPCHSPTTYNSLAAGDYQFAVNATDSSGNQGIATFEFTVLQTPTIEGLQDHIKSLEIRKNLKASLNAPLKHALALLEDDNSNNDKGVCGKLKAFINKVNAKAGKGLNSQVAEELVDEASRIRDSLGC